MHPLNWRLIHVGFKSILLMSDEFSIEDPESRKIYHDMNQPISHYWINSSHNTFVIHYCFRVPFRVPGTSPSFYYD